jgi:hypothetical protein
MIINFNDLQIPFHRLALGTILEHENGERWVKFYFEGAPMWMNTFNVDDAYQTDKEILDFIDQDVWSVIV